MGRWSGIATTSATGARTGLGPISMSTRGEIEAYSFVRLRPNDITRVDAAAGRWFFLATGGDLFVTAGRTSQKRMGPSPNSG